MRIKAIPVAMGGSSGLGCIYFRSHLKKVFWPKRCVGSSFQILDIHEYACGLKLGPALILNPNPNFEMASNETQVFYKNIR
jgi:hypothetical protein